MLNSEVCILKRLKLSYAGLIGTKCYQNDHCCIIHTTGVLFNCPANTRLVLTHSRTHTLTHTQAHTHTHTHTHTLLHSVLSLEKMRLPLCLHPLPSGYIHTPCTVVCTHTYVPTLQHTQIVCSLIEIDYGVNMCLR